MEQLTFWDLVWAVVLAHGIIFVIGTVLAWSIGVISDIASSPKYPRRGGTAKQTEQEFRQAMKEND